jgi:hypothetical protein
MLPLLSLLTQTHDDVPPSASERARAEQAYYERYDDADRWAPPLYALMLVLLACGLALDLARPPNG